MKRFDLSQMTHIDEITVSQILKFNINAKDEQSYMVINDGDTYFRVKQVLIPDLYILKILDAQITT